MNYICRQKTSDEKIDQCSASCEAEAVEYFAGRKQLPIDEWEKIYYVTFQY